MTRDAVLLDAAQERRHIKPSRARKRALRGLLAFPRPAKPGPDIASLHGLPLAIFTKISRTRLASRRRPITSSEDAAGLHFHSLAEAALVRAPSHAAMLIARYSQRRRAAYRRRTLKIWGRLLPTFISAA